jgi:hypothetical protein
MGWGDASSQRRADAEWVHLPILKRYQALRDVLIKAPELRQDGDLGLPAPPGPASTRSPSSSEGNGF